jgi:diguanylate cyclase (GGDEF)-like protein/PAS domain S-box-containing protein
MNEPNSERDIRHSASILALYEVVVATSKVLLLAKTPETLYKMVCDAAVEGGLFSICAILGSVTPTSSIRIEAAAAVDAEALRRLPLLLAGLTSDGDNIVSSAFRYGIPSVNNNLLTLAQDNPWLAEAKTLGVASGVAVPLIADGHSIGVLLLYSSTNYFFDDEVVSLISHMANSIGFALINFEHEMDRTCAEDSLRVSEEKYRTILEALEEAYYEVDLKGRPILNNSAFFRMLGYVGTDVKGFDYRHHYTEAIASDIYNIFHEVYLTGESRQNLYWEFLHKNGNVVQVEGSVNLIRNAVGEPVGFRGIFRDVTARSKTEEALRASEARFRSLTNLSSDWYWEQDIDSRFTRVESRHEENDPTQEHVLGMRPWESGYAIEAKGGWEQHRQTIASRLPFRDVVLRRKLSSGSPSYISMSGEPVFTDTGDFVGYRGVSREITKQKTAEEQIKYLATHDGLTGLPNRAMFSQLINLGIPLAKRYKRNFAVLFVDLDRFKFINDTLGHDAGDQLLQELTARFKHTIRASDVIARLGGDEFVVLVQEMTDARQASTVARKLLAAAMKPIALMGQECRVTASIGIAIFPDDGDDEQSLMKNADIAMYFAKEEGKNNYQFFSKDIKSHSLERMTLEANLRYALERNEFSVHYQAKVDLNSGRINGVEALLRWQNPTLGSVSPVQFIPIAEETGMIVAIGKWVLETACAQNVEWQRQGLPPICMAVNLSVRQFADEHLLRDIAAVLKNTGMAPHLLELEITEGMVIHHPEHAIQLLTSIKKLGVRLAIDDFGTGYSSLGQLKNFPIDTLKVDRSFIRDIATNLGDKAITEAIIAMGKTLSLTVVAEGVETPEQESFLREHACDEMQGYYFSKPIAAGAFSELLRENEVRLAGKKGDLDT